MKVRLLIFMIVGSYVKEIIRKLVRKVISRRIEDNFKWIPCGLQGSIRFIMEVLGGNECPRTRIGFQAGFLLQRESIMDMVVQYFL